MNKNMSKIGVLIVLLFVPVLFFFQNCSQTKFADASSTSIKMSDVGLDSGGDEDPDQDITVDTPSHSSSDQGTSFKITEVGHESYVLVCNKSDVQFTNIGQGAKVVLVNSRLKSVTSLQKEALVLLVNSESPIKSIHIRNINFQGIIRDADRDETQVWSDKCRSMSDAVVPESTPSFLVNQLTAENLSTLPSLAHRYQMTVIGLGLVLPHVHSNLFKVTHIKESAALSVKTKVFQATSLARGVNLEVY